MMAYPIRIVMVLDTGPRDEIPVKMRALLAIRLAKAVVEAGRWRQEKMPRHAFPLSKSKGYALGSQWDWCVYRLSAGIGFFKLLIAFHAGKEEYRAWLALEDGADSALLARLEYHPALHGWHVHLRKSDTSEVARGVVKESTLRELRTRPARAALRLRGGW
jgi:hypothetical protein